MTEQENIDLELELEQAARPLIKFLNERSNPHAIVVVNTTSAELFEAKLIANTEDYLKD